jgi:[ribosomal protein S5]-alanine N-acetyltransferase
MISYSSGIGFYVVRLLTSNEPLGICGLVKREGLEDTDIGFAFLPKFSGKGYALEAATAMLHHAHTQLQLRSVVAITTTDNIRSANLLQKLGMRFSKNIELDNEVLRLFSTDVKDAAL